MFCELYATDVFEGTFHFFTSYQKNINREVFSVAHMLSMFYDCHSLSTLSCKYTLSDLFLFLHL